VNKAGLVVAQAAGNTRAFAAVATIVSIGALADGPSVTLHSLLRERGKP
jgi:hypothetical protein